MEVRSSLIAESPSVAGGQVPELPEAVQFFPAANDHYCLIFQVIRVRSVMCLACRGIPLKTCLCLDTRPQTLLVGVIFPRMKEQWRFLLNMPQPCSPLLQTGLYVFLRRIICHPRHKIVFTVPLNDCDSGWAKTIRTFKDFSSLTDDDAQQTGPS